jgi:hypothetical protein
MSFFDDIDDELAAIERMQDTRAQQSATAPTEDEPKAKKQKRLKKREEDSSSSSDTEEEISLGSDSEDKVPLDEEDGEDDDDEDSGDDMVDDEDNPVFLDGASDEEEEDRDSLKPRRKRKKASRKARGTNKSFVEQQAQLHAQLSAEDEDGSFCIAFTPLRTDLAGQDYATVYAIASTVVQEVSDDAVMEALGCVARGSMLSRHSCADMVPIHVVMASANVDAATARREALKKALPARWAQIIISIRMPRACALMMASPMAIYRLRVKPTVSRLRGIEPSDLFFNPLLDIKAMSLMATNALTTAELLRYEWLPFECRTPLNQACCSSLPIRSNVAVEFHSNSAMELSLPAELQTGLGYSELVEQWQFTDPLTIKLPAQESSELKAAFSFNERGELCNQVSQTAWKMPPEVIAGSRVCLVCRPLKARILMNKQLASHTSNARRVADLFGENRVIKAWRGLMPSTNLYTHAHSNPAAEIAQGLNTRISPHTFVNSAEKIAQVLERLRGKNFAGGGGAVPAGAELVRPTCVANKINTMPPQMLDWLILCALPEKGAEPVAKRWNAFPRTEALKNAADSVFTARQRYQVANPKTVTPLSRPWIYVPDDVLYHLSFAYTCVLPEAFWFVALHTSVEFATLLLLDGGLKMAHAILSSCVPHDLLFVDKLNGGAYNFLRRRLAVHVDKFDPQLPLELEKLSERIRHPLAGPPLRALAELVRKTLCPTTQLSRVCELLCYGALISQLLVDQRAVGGNSVFLTTSAIEMRDLPLFARTTLCAVPLSGGRFAFVERAAYNVALGFVALADSVDGPLAGIDVVRIETRADHDEALKKAVGAHSTENVVLLCVNEAHASMLKALFPGAVMGTGDHDEPQIRILSYRCAASDVPRYVRPVHLIVPYAHSFAQHELLAVLRLLTMKLPQSNAIGDFERVVAEAACGMTFARQVPGIMKHVRELYLAAPCVAPTLTLIGLPLSGASPVHSAPLGPSLVDDLYFSVDGARPLAMFHGNREPGEDFLRVYSGRGALLEQLVPIERDMDAFHGGVQRAKIGATLVTCVSRLRDCSPPRLYQMLAKHRRDQQSARAVVCDWTNFPFLALEYCSEAAVYALGSTKPPLCAPLEVAVLDSVPSSGLVGFDYSEMLGESRALHAATSLMDYSLCGATTQDVGGQTALLMKRLSQLDESMFDVPASKCDSATPFHQQLSDTARSWAEQKKHRFGASLQLLMGTLFYEPEHMIVLGDIDEVFTQRLLAKYAPSAVEKTPLESGEPCNWFNSYGACSRSILPYLLESARSNFN